MLVWVLNTMGGARMDILSTSTLRKALSRIMRRARIQQEPIGVSFHDAPAFALVPYRWAEMMEIAKTCSRKGTILNNAVLATILLKAAGELKKSSEPMSVVDLVECIVIEAYHIDEFHRKKAA